MCVCLPVGGGSVGMYVCMRLTRWTEERPDCLGGHLAHRDTGRREFLGTVAGLAAEFLRRAVCLHRSHYRVVVTDCGETRPAE